MMRSLLAALRQSVTTVVSMAPLRNATGPSDEESAVAIDGDDSPTAKKPLRAESRIPLFVIFSVGLLCIFLTMPEAEHETILRPTRHLSVLK
ncbi:SNARE associated Golgi protein [Musa troglodytarum]|uniref:SNARE associated Golgi protein n=1 Tax=Musa troglodytarum TaxID=320322 RepID=A0A9E7I9T6_9LILI|nr:SNARE associated Golgi protein [Musa troglodytarum]